MDRRTWAAMPPILLGLLLLARLPAAPTDEPDQRGTQPPRDGNLPPGGPPPFGPGGPPPFGFGGPMGQQRKLVKQFDKDGDGRLNKEERQAARAFLKKERPAGGRGRFGPGGRGGFGPAIFLTRPLLEALDADKDGKVTKDELRAGVNQFFTAVDKGKKGSLDEARVAAGLNGMLPRPPGFPGGPPGGGVRGFGPGNFLAGAIIRRADANKDGKVTRNELTAAAEVLFREADKDRDGKIDEGELGTGIGLLLPAPPGFGPPGGFGGRLNREPPKPGPRVAPADVKSYPDASLYEPTVLRTLFLEFEDKDWEAELEDFHGTDVEVPATLTVDGKKYPSVGVHFRGMSSYMMVPAGRKRSLNLKLDFADPKQRLYGYKTLNLLNSHDDPSFLSTVLYSHIARQYIPAPKANCVKVVLNGESWGVYVNTQQFDKVFLKENYKTTKGTRWKVRGGPGGGGGLDYLGDNVAAYRRRYEIKSGDNAKAWKALIKLCKTLSQTPADDLEKALAPLMDVDGLLWFLALDVALINDDGYWIRASDYSLYLDDKGKFHVIPHDMNEAFRPAGGPGFGGPGGPGGPGRPGGRGPGGFGPGGPGFGGRGGGVDLDPLIGLNDPRKPLRSKVLAVPGLRAKYLQHVRTIAEKSLDWKDLGPVVAGYRKLIDKEVEADTRKLDSFAEFDKLTADVVAAEAPPRGRGPAAMILRAFADQRRNYLLNHPEIKKAASPGAETGKRP